MPCICLEPNRNEDDMSQNTRWMLLAAFVAACILIYALY